VWFCTLANGALWAPLALGVLVLNESDARRRLVAAQIARSGSV